MVVERLARHRVGSDLIGSNRIGSDLQCYHALVSAAMRSRAPFWPPPKLRWV